MMELNTYIGDIVKIMDDKENIFKRVGMDRDRLASQYWCQHSQGGCYSCGFNTETIKFVTICTNLEKTKADFYIFVELTQFKYWRPMIVQMTFSPFGRVSIFEMLKIL